MSLEEKRKKLDRPSLKVLKPWKNIIGVEIGVQYGVNARDILERFDIKTLYLIDPYTLYPAISGKVAGEDYIEAEERARNFLKGFEDKIIWIKEFSWNAVSLVPDNLDFIYIDGDHRKHIVKRDLELYYPKVRSGGLFSGHDYANRAPGVVSAVDEFFSDKEEKVFSGGTWDWWIIKK